MTKPIFLKILLTFIVALVFVFAPKAASARRGSGSRGGGTLTEAAASTVEAIPVSAAADSPSAVLAVERPCRPPGWAGGT
jgi:hypothetical protein